MKLKMLKCPSVRHSSTAQLHSAFPAPTLAKLPYKGIAMTVLGHASHQTRYNRPRLRYNTELIHCAPGIAQQAIFGTGSLQNLMQLEVFEWNMKHKTRFTTVCHSILYRVEILELCQGFHNTQQNSPQKAIKSSFYFYTAPMQTLRNDSTSHQVQLLILLI